MSIWIDRKYLGFVSSRLELFKQKKQDLYNFRCPYCGDSKKNKLKARGYVYRKSNDYFYICHNCGKSTTFGKLLEELDGTVYKQYSLERYTDGKKQEQDYSHLRGNAHSRFQSTRDTSVSVEHQEIPHKTWANVSLSSVATLPDGHYAREYIRNRKIPDKYWNEIFYTDAFKDFLDKDFPGHDKEDVPNDDRIVLFFTDSKGNITNVSGRALSDTKVRYTTAKLSEEKKLFGTHRLKLDRKFYVVEGQFDSFFLDNCVASGDSNLAGVAVLYPDAQSVLVYDNEPRNKEIVKQIERSIDKGFAVCMFPENAPGKDINEMVQNGLTVNDIASIIEQNTYSGLTAKMHFTQWKRC